MSLRFEWNGVKAASNARKHGITFEEASTVFGDVFSSTLADPDHSTDEARFVTIGQSVYGRILVVSHTDRGDRIRIISARLATRRERKQYTDVTD